MRLDIERQQELEPKRMEFAIQEIEKLGFKITYKDKTKINFWFKGSAVHFYPYSGWATGKTIKDGRGIDKLIKQIRP
jgi:hypothetical protein